MVRVAVIGAGVSGLTAVKCCVDEGIDVVCFEADDHIGGLWYFTEDVQHSSICRSTVINTSKEMMSYSDFPVPSEFPIYMHNTKVEEYLNLYADHFGLKKYIQLNTKVVYVSRASDSRDTKYNVTYTTYGKEVTAQVCETFDGVMVCTGHHWKPMLPSFDGMDIFKGAQMHSKGYKDFKPFKDKVVVVVGVGNSSGDIATELSRHCSKVYLSTRRGTWIFPRNFRGYPLDQVKNTRMNHILPISVARALTKTLISLRYDHDRLGLTPDCPLFSHHPMVNDDLPARIMYGTVCIKPNIKCLTETSVIFEDGTEVKDVDAVIYGTGFEIGFPCLAPGLVDVQDNRVTLYKYVFPPDQQNLAVIGCLQPIGAVMPLSELQARWAARVFKGICKLPTEDRMHKDIQKKWDDMQNFYVHSKRHTIQVDYVEYGDELAKEIGCQPDILHLLWKDPILALKCIFGPMLPYQYRLRGPGKWDGARDAIFANQKNLMCATQTRVVQRSRKKQGLEVSVWVAVLVLWIALCIWYTYCCK